MAAATARLTSASEQLGLDFIVFSVPTILTGLYPSSRQFPAFYSARVLFGAIKPQVVGPCPLQTVVQGLGDFSGRSPSQTQSPSGMRTNRSLPVHDHSAGTSCRPYTSTAS